MVNWRSLMKTIVYHMTEDKIDLTAIKHAADLIKKGEVVAFPTETVYGLGADALNPQAVKKIFEVKGRPADNPIIVHISDIEQLHELTAEIPPIARKLAEKFWPGPLTLLFKKKTNISPIVTGGLETIAIRMPRNKIALSLIDYSGTPIAAPSANLSGRPSPTTAHHVISDFNGKIPLILDGGPTPIGVESTVVNILTEPPIILRPGGVTAEQLRTILPTVTIYHPPKKMSRDEPVLSPGMKYRHYAPKGRLILVTNLNENNYRKIDRLLTSNPLDDSKKRLLCLHPEHVHDVPAQLIKIVGKTLAEIQKNLFKELRQLDEDHIELCFVEEVVEEQEGLAIMNRLKKASSETLFL